MNDQNSIPPNGGELSDEQKLELQKYEELYALAKEAYRMDFNRLELLESRLARLVMLLVIVLGATVFGVDKYLQILRASKTMTEYSFLVLSFGFALACLLAFCYFLRSMSVTARGVLPVDDTLVKHFKEHKYPNAILSMTKSFLIEASKIRESANKKADYIDMGFRLIWVTLFLAVASTVFYLLIELASRTEEYRNVYF